MKLSVPFIPDPGYADFLAERSGILESVYFPLPTPGVWDARIRTPWSWPEVMDIRTLASHLSPLDRVKKYIIINTRFVLPQTYSDLKTLISFLDNIALLAEQTPIQGIVFSDFYLLHALDRTEHRILPSLEAVPGINAMTDTWDKIQTCFDMLSATGFKPPSRLLVDRSLNRDLNRLIPLAGQVKREFPHIKVELLANEGCIMHCPFKPAHDAQIALSNTGLIKEETWRMNRDFGCQKYFFNNPEHFFKSPFIRPEDQRHYAGIAHTIKLAGRSLGLPFLKTCIRAYETGSFEGNLLDLMDATHFLADHVYIDNKSLGKDFFTQLSSCTNNCETCNICHELFLNTAQKLPLSFKPYKDVQ